MPDSPFRVLAADRLDASMVRLFGPALEPGVRALMPTHFNVDAHGAGRGEMGRGWVSNIKELVTDS